MSFDRLAPHYTWMERVLAGLRLQRSIAWLPALAGARHVLVAGVGHGHFVARAAQVFPELRFTCLDASAGMLRAAARRLQREPSAAARIEWVHATLPAWPSRPPSSADAPAHFDAIVTHFFLDCFAPEELGALVAALAAVAQPRATWLIADFALPERGLARQRARATHALMYAFFRRVAGIRARRLTEPDSWLRSAGFRLAGRRGFEWGLLRSDCWQRV